MQKSTREGAFLYNVELLTSQWWKRLAAPALYIIVAPVKISFTHEEVREEIHQGQ